MTDAYNAVIANNNQLLEQVGDAIGRNDTIDGRAAIADCLAIILKSSREATANDFRTRIHDSLSSEVRDND